MIAWSRSPNDSRRSKKSSAISPTNGSPRSPEARTCRTHHPGGRTVRIAQPCVHDAAGEQPRVRVAAGRSLQRSRERPGRQPGQPEPCGNQAKALSGPRDPGAREKEPVAREHDPVAEPLRDPSRARSRRRERRARRFHEQPELHARRARRLAAPARHTFLHGRPECVVDRRVLRLDRAHRGDSSAR